mgnify:FL=1
MKTFNELINEIEEALKRTVVFRAGKKIIKKKSNKAGFKNVGGKEGKMKPSELRTRAKAAKKSAKKRKGKSSQIARKRAKTMKKRTSSGN